MERKNKQTWVGATTFNDKLQNVSVLIIIKYVNK